MMDVMASVQLGTAMGAADDPDPRMEFPKFEKEELNPFAELLETKGLLTADKILSTPLGFYLLTNFAIRKSGAVMQCGNFIVDCLKLKEASPMKIKKQVNHMKNYYLKYDEKKFRPLKGLYKKDAFRKPRTPPENLEELYKKHIDDSKGMQAFFITEIDTLHVETDKKDDQNDTYDVAEAIAFAYLTKNILPTWISTDSYFQYLRFLKIQMETSPEDTWFQSFRTMGRGGFGLVRGCKNLTTGKLYAMKEMDMKRVKQRSGWHLCKNEHEVLTTVHSPFTVSLAYAYKDQGKLKLIMDLMMGGDLAYQMHQHRQTTGKNMPEDFAIYYAARTVLGLEVLHEHNIVYRDLKPENVLIHDDGRSMLSDMGLATKMKPGLKGMCGTMGYAAPEMFDKKATYSFPVDWWSLGCMVWALVEGASPFRTNAACKFNGATDPSAGMKAATCDMEVVPSSHLSANMKDFLLRLLDKNPETRLGSNGGAAEVKAHPVFKKVSWKTMAADEFPDSNPRAVEAPPIVPGKSLNIQDQEKIGDFDPIKDVELTDSDFPDKDWVYMSPFAFQSEVVWLLAFLATPEGKQRLQDNLKAEAESSKSSACTIL